MRALHAKHWMRLRDALARQTALLLLFLGGRALSFSASNGNTCMAVRVVSATCRPFSGKGLEAAADDYICLTPDEETWAAQRACARLSDSHVAAFRKDGFVTLRKGVPCEFEAYLAAVQQGQGNSLQELARKAPPRAMVRRPTHPWRY